MQRTQWRPRDYSEYGLGFRIERIGNRRGFGHGGGFPGQRTLTLCDPQNQLVVSVLANCVDADAYKISKGIFSIIDQFQAYPTKKESTRLNRLHGRFMNDWFRKDLVVIGDQIFLVDSCESFPFDNADKLTYLDAKTLKVICKSPYAPDRELLHLNFKGSGPIKTIRYGGMTLWTESEYMNKLAKKSRRKQSKK